MVAKIGLIGVPIETVRYTEPSGEISRDISVPSITYKTRRLIIERGLREGIAIEDLGEVCLNGGRGLPIDIDRKTTIGIIHYNAMARHRVDFSRLDAERKRVLGLGKEFDLLVAVGPSHLGALILYQEGDIVARLDYHSDFWKVQLDGVNYATYMGWLAIKGMQVDVTNYFVKFSCVEDGNRPRVFGRFADGVEDTSYKKANHFDIDVDCIHSRFGIQDIYPHSEGPADATPEMVTAMIREAKPEKIGIWEYRPSSDKYGNGLELVVNSIKNAIRS